MLRIRPTTIACATALVALTGGSFGACLPDLEVDEYRYACSEKAPCAPGYLCDPASRSARRIFMPRT